MSDNNNNTSSLFLQEIEHTVVALVNSFFLDAEQIPHDILLERILGAVGCEYGYLVDINESYLNALGMSSSNLASRVPRKSGSAFDSWGESPSVGSRTMPERSNQGRSLDTSEPLICLRSIKLPNGKDRTKEVENVILYSDTVFSKPYVKRDPVFTNSPKEDKAPYNMPREHPQLENYCGIPIFSCYTPKREIIAILGLGNRKGGWSAELVKCLNPLRKVIALCLENWRNNAPSRAALRKKQLPKITQKMAHPETGIKLKTVKKSKLLGSKKETKDCFQAKDAIAWLLKSNVTGKRNYDLPMFGRDDALQLLSELADSGFLCLPEQKSKIEVDEDTLFTFNMSISASPKKVINPKQTKEEAYSLHKYIRARDIFKLQKQLEKKVFIENINTQNSSNQTALHIAIEENYDEAVEFLLKVYQSSKNANIHVQDYQGYTPLHTAATKGNKKIITSLLKFPKINIEATNTDGNTPFHTFCHQYPDPLSLKEVFALFYDKGANLGVVNGMGETPLHKSVLNPSTRVLMCKEVLEHQVNVNAINSNGATALHYCVFLKRRDLALLLLQYGADMRIKSANNKSPMELAEEQKVEDVHELFKMVDEMESFLKRKEVGLDNFVTAFIKEGLFMEELKLMNEDLFRGLNIDISLGEILRLTEALRKTNPAPNPEDVRPKDKTPPSTLTESLGNKGKKQGLIRHRGLHTQNEGTSSEDLSSLRNTDGWFEWKDLEFIEPIGSGTSGDVFRGRYKDIPNIAIKVLEREQNEDFKHEFKILSKVKGENILLFHGAAITPKPALVMEYCSRGSVHDILKDPEIGFGWQDFFNFADQMNNGLFSLHNFMPQIFHRDLKSMNFLVTQDMKIKVADFGLSRMVNSMNMKTLYNLRGTLNYCAPEIFDGQKFTTKSDIYSLGIIFWELLYRVVAGVYQTPYAEYPEMDQPIQIIVAVAKKGIRPTIPNRAKLPASLTGLINTMWASDPSDRHETFDIKMVLPDIQQEYEDNTEEWQSFLLPPQNKN